MEDWNEVMKGIYRDAECEPERIYDCALTGGEEITKNAMLYLPDIMWELYLEGLIDSDEDYEIDYTDEEWEEYSSLLYIYDKDEAPEKIFAEKAGMLKAVRSKITLLNFIHLDKCKVEEDHVIFPNYAFVPIYILCLQNKDFLALFTYGDKNKIKYGKNIIKYGNELMKYDNYHIFRYTYEKLTGVNLALLFANYFKDMIKCVGSLGVFNISKYEIVEDKEWKENGKMYKEQLKEGLLSFLGEIMTLPTVFGRIIWADIILQSLYAEEKKYINKYDVYDLRTARIGYSSNGAVLVDILYNMEGIRREIKIERERFNASEEYYTCFTVSTQYYELYREFILERIKNVHQNEKDIVIYNQCSEAYNQIKLIISEIDENNLIGSGDVGKYIREDVKDNPKKQMPVIFIRADIMDDPKYEEIVNEFLTYALVESNKRE